MREEQFLFTERRQTNDREQTAVTRHVYRAFAYLSSFHQSKSFSRTDDVKVTVVTFKLLNFIIRLNFMNFIIKFITFIKSTRRPASADRTARCQGQVAEVNVA